MSPLSLIEEFRKWGPLDAEGYPIKAEEGRTFEAFLAALTTGVPEDHPDMPEILDAIGQWVPKAALVRGMGCQVEHQVRIAANAGAGTGTGTSWHLLRIVANKRVGSLVIIKNNVLGAGSSSVLRSALAVLRFIASVGLTTMMRKPPRCVPTLRKSSRPRTWSMVIC